MRLRARRTPIALPLVLLLSVSGACWAQHGRSAEQAARAAEHADRAARASERAERATEASEKADRAVRAAERAERATRTVEAAQQRSERAQDRVFSLPAQAAQRAQERAGGKRGAAMRAEHGRNLEQGKAAKGGNAKGANRGRATVDPGSSAARRMAQSQQQGLEEMVRAHPRELEMTAAGPAVRGQVVALDPSPSQLAAARRAGFRIVSREEIEGLGMVTVTLRVPGGVSVDQAIGRLARLAPRGDFTPNYLHVQSGTVPAAATAALRTPLAQGRVAGLPAIGIIDGGVARHPSLLGPIEQRGFAQGAPFASGHATAIASLATGHERPRGAAPGTPLLVADIYGTDPAGGNALALVRALGWMAASKVPVVLTPLAGPPNRLVARAIERASQRGLFVVAPVGNGGPAAPPAYPASYPSVIAVTAVDRGNRLLIESGRSAGIDYAAPGGGILAGNVSGGMNRVRGTSFGVPFVAGRLFLAARLSRQPLAILDREAVDLGARGPDPIFGRGLVCAKCGTR